MSQLQNTNLIEIRQVYWSSSDFDKYRSQAMNQTQPFVSVKFPFHCPYF